MASSSRKKRARKGGEKKAGTGRNEKKKGTNNEKKLAAEVRDEKELAKERRNEVSRKRYAEDADYREKLLAYQRRVQTRAQRPAPAAHAGGKGQAQRARPGAMGDGSGLSRRKARLPRRKRPQAGAQAAVRAVMGGLSGDAGAPRRHLRHLQMRIHPHTAR